VDKRFEELCCFYLQVPPRRERYFVCLKCSYPPTRPHCVTTQKTVISGAFFLRLVHSNGWSNNDCNEGQSGSPFNYSLSQINFVRLQKHIRDCAVSSVLHFHRLFVAKRQRVRVSRSHLYETMAVCHCSE